MIFSLFCQVILVKLLLLSIHPFYSLYAENPGYPTSLLRPGLGSQPSPPLAPTPRGPLLRIVNSPPTSILTGLSQPSMG